MQSGGQVTFSCFLWFFSNQIGLSLLRLGLFLSLYVTGYEFWLFPDLYHPEKGFFDSFVPLYSIGKTDKLGWFEITSKAVIFGTLLYIAWFVWQTDNSLRGFVEHIWEIIGEIFDWGNTKIEEYHVGF